MENEKIYDKIRRHAFRIYQGIFFETFFEIARVMLEGKKKYKRDDWEDRPINHHLEHIRAHLDKFEKEPIFSNYEELTHAATRCIMLAQAQINKNNHEYKRQVLKEGLPTPKNIDFNEFKSIKKHFTGNSGLL